MGMTSFTLSLHRPPTAAAHWDLMIRRGNVLWTWRCLPLPLRELLRVGTAAMRIADHRLVYLEHRGPVRGGSLGTITPLCRGDAEWDAAARDGDVIGVRLVVPPAGGFHALCGYWSLPLQQGWRGFWYNTDPRPRGPGHS